MLLTIKVKPIDINIYYKKSSMLRTRIQKFFLKSFSSQKNLGLMTNKQKDAYLSMLESNIKIPYKHYPYLPHQDPHSKEYIPSQLDQLHDKREVQSYNQLIDNFKHDLKMQRQVWDAINNLDRPYKKGIPGIDTNLDPNGLAKPQLKDLGFPRNDWISNFPWTNANEDRWIATSPYHFLCNFKHLKQWEQQRKNRPVTRVFNDKGYKYDVAVKPQDKFQYLADRLGHPQYLGTPFQWLLRLQNDMYHPNYLDQPFVKLPSMGPHESLNFQQGQVIYQNTQVMQWIKFWQMFIFSAGAFGVIFVPLNMVFRTNLVTDVVDQFFFTQYHLVSPTNVDILRLSIPVVAGAGFYGSYFLLNLPNAFLSDYIVKMSYSKDKELLFVKRVDLHGAIIEQVHEMAHLEILPPTQRTGVAGLSSQDQDGLWKVTCMNTQKTFLMYNNPKFWNTDLKDDFLRKLLTLWDKSYYGFNREQSAENIRKWRESAKESINQQALPKQ